MRGIRWIFVLCVAGCLLAVALAISSFAAPQLPRRQTDPTEDKIWQLEADYWRYVQLNDLKSYAALWDPNFLGWPSISPAPVRKDHITDWITSQTRQGRSLTSFQIDQASFQLNGDIAVSCYWATYTWGDVKSMMPNAASKGEASRVRILHTWRKSGDTWLIISGMSMPEAAPPQK